MQAELRQYLSSIVVGLDPVERFRQAVGQPDDWQHDILRADPRHSPDDAFIAVLCSRQLGKSTTVAGLAWDDLTRGKQVLIAAPSERQSRELLRRCSAFRDADPAPPKIVRANLTELEADNGGRIICVPATDQARGFTCDTLVVEEAAFVADEAIAALLPMRKADGRVLMISTPKGREGFFFETWTEGKVRKIAARSVDVPRVKAKVAFDRKFMSELRFRVEHLCEFLGAGLPLISLDVLDNAISTEPALCLS